MYSQIGEKLSALLTRERGFKLMVYYSAHLIGSTPRFVPFVSYGGGLFNSLMQVA